MRPRTKRRTTARIDRRPLVAVLEVRRVLAATTTAGACVAFILMVTRINWRRRQLLVPNGCGCEALEPRRMLAVFNGTSGNDTINISIVAGGTGSIVQIVSTRSVEVVPDRLHLELTELD